MGVFADLLAQARTFNPRDQIYGEITKLKNRNDPDLPTEFALTDEVQTIPAFSDTVSGGTFTLTLRLRGYNPITTAPLAFDADAATIEAAIDLALAAVVGWTDGDIAVAVENTDLTDGYVTLTYDGDSVAGQDHGLVSLDGTGLFVDGLGIAQTTAGNETDTAEVQTIAQFLHVPTGGTFHVAFSLVGADETIEFGVDVPFDATDTEFETLIDAAAVAAGYSAWAGEIAVSAEVTDLTDGDMVLTFGAGLLEEFANHDLSVVDGSGLTGGLVDDPPEVTAEGQTARPAWAALYLLGVIADSTPPPQQAPVAVTAGPNQLRIKPAVIRELAQEAAFEDGNNSTYHAICDVLFPYDRSPLVQR